VIVFNCGRADHDPISTTVTFAKETVLDGKGLVTLDAAARAHPLSQQRLQHPDAAAHRASASRSSAARAPRLAATRAGRRRYL